MTGLPANLEEYFAAQNAHDTNRLLSRFSPDATVRDEGEDLTGSAAIRGWIEKTSAKYGATAEPLEYRSENGRTVVVARVSGNFPGSPVDLTFRFGFNDNGLINALEIGL